MSDLDHLSVVKTNLLYSHWQQRQDKGLIPFIILNSSPVHGTLGKKSKKLKGKAKMEYVDVDSDDEHVQMQEEEKDNTEGEEDGDEIVQGEEEEEDDDMDKGNAIFYQGRNYIPKDYEL